MAFYFFILFGFVATWLLLRVLIPHLQNRLLDHPNERSSHLHPTPRGGGVAFVLVTSACSVFELLNGLASSIAAIPLLALPLAVVGFIDDRHNLPASWRYCIQLLTATLMLIFSSLSYPLCLAIVSGNWLLIFSIAFLVIGATALINFTNFMDGLDGLVAGCMAVAVAALATALDAPWSIWALLGSLIGFLFLNWSPARVFMGDVGSTFLGAVFTGLVLHAFSWIEAFSYLLVATPLLADACFCVFRRFLVGQRVFQAHRLHLFQRLHQAGWPHARVSLTYITATAVLAAALLAGGWPWVLGLAVVEFLFGVWLDQRIAVPFSVASSN